MTFDLDKISHILVFCYAYPPYPGIGGRRWVKFAKELKRNGVEVSVISSDPPAAEHSVWKNGASLTNHIILPLKYPRSLILFPKSLAGRIRYKFDLLKIKLLTKENYYDRTIFWKQQLIEAYSILIKNNDITHVVISAAPFSWLSHVDELRKLNPSVKFVADIRDPWTTNKSAYGFSALSPKRMKVEWKAELKMLQNFDKVITVNDAISDYFKSLSPNNSEKLVTIPNGFDLDEMGQVFPIDLIWNSEKINLVFTGSFYTNATYLFKALVSSLNKLKQELGNLPFHFYFLGPNVDALKLSIDKDLISDFTIGYYSDLANVNAVIAKANYTILFLTDDINNSLSTKFCEYIKFKKKIIVFSKPGYTGNYVQQNKLGYHFSEQDIEKGLRVLMGMNRQESFPEDFNIDKFSIKGLTNELMDALGISKVNGK